MDDQTFYIAKGVVGLASTIALLVHMNRSWGAFDRDPHTGLTTGCGQRLRYLCLFYFAVLITSVTGDQIRNNAQIDFRAIGAFGGVVLLALTAMVSLSEAREKRQSNR